MYVDEHELNAGSLGFVLSTCTLKDWIMSNLGPDMTKFLAIEEAGNSTSSYEVTEDCSSTLKAISVCALARVESSIDRFCQCMRYRVTASELIDRISKTA